MFLGSGCQVVISDLRERSNEELKSKGRIEREMQWGSKVKESSVLQNISRGMVSLQKRCVNLFFSQVGRDKLSLQELNKGTLQSSKGAGLSSHSRDKGPSSQTVVFPVVMHERESWSIKELSAEELMLLNCGVGEDS